MIAQAAHHRQPALQHFQPILFHLLPWADLVEDQHSCCKKEVVDRMVAEPGNKEYGRLSVMLQWRYDMEVGGGCAARVVHPTAEGGLCRGAHGALCSASRRQPCHLGRVGGVAFSQRRKILRNTLGQWIEQKDWRPTSIYNAERKKCRWPTTFNSLSSQLEAPDLQLRNRSSALRPATPGGRPTIATPASARTIDSGSGTALRTKSRGSRLTCRHHEAVIVTRLTSSSH